MAVFDGTALKMETWNGITVPYFFCPEEGEFLSVHETIITSGRIKTAHTGVLRPDGGSGVSTTRGVILPHDCKVLWVAMSHRADSSPANVELRVYDDGTDVWSVNWSQGDQYSGVDISSGSDVTLSIGNNGGGTSVGPNNPHVRVGLRWRNPA